MVAGGVHHDNVCMCVWSFTSLEVLVFKKRSWTHGLNIVDVDNANANDKTPTPMTTPESDLYVVPAY